MRRKKTRQSPGPTCAEKRHMTWIKERMVCATGCSEHEQLVIAHHCEGSTFKNNKILIGHWFVIGLCELCDQCITRESRRAFRDRFGPQSQLWLQQFECYPFKDECPLEVIEAIRDWVK